VRFPQEVVVERFLPTYRALLARALAERGLSQDAIAARVGVSQAQVSKYLSGKLDPVEAIAGDPRVQATVEQVAEGLAEGTLDEVSALAESLGLIRRLENRGPICELHERAMPALEGTGCDACIDPGSRVMREHQVLVDVRGALRRLLALEGFVDWVPHVGSNLAQASEDAQGPFEVAALPGRINRVEGRARASTSPAFGASEHVATIVLAAGAVHPGVRAAVNVAHRHELVDRVEAEGGRAIAFDPDYEGRGEHVRDRLRSLDEPPTVLYHEGAFGIEPNAYVLGATAHDVVDRLERLIR